jgi:hypothetical protein
MGSYAMQALAVWNDEEVRNEMDGFGREVTATSTDINAHRNALIAAGAPGTRFWNDWQIFTRDLTRYTASHPRSGIPMVNTAYTTYIAALVPLVDRYNDLETRFRALSGVERSSNPADTRAGSIWSRASEAASGAITGGPGLLVIGLVGVVAVAVIAMQVRAFAAPALAAMRRNTRRRRRSR